MDVITLMFSFFVMIVWTTQPSSCLTELEAGPENRTVIEGERTSFICDFNDDNDKTIFWARVNSLGVQKFISVGRVVISSTSANSGDYDLVVDEDEQTYELVFNRVSEAADDSWYECGYQYGQNIKYETLARVYLTVLPEEYSFSCQYWHLPLAGADADPEVEVACVWNREVVMTVADANFGSSGVKLAPDLRYSDRIISRMELDSVDDSVDIICEIVFDRNGSSVSVKESCSNAYGTDDTDGIIRVDPFINEVLPGSEAEFKCTESEESTVLSKFWQEVNMTHSVLSEGQVIGNKSSITISRVNKGDEVLLIVCRGRADLSGTTTLVNSFGGIRVISPSTIAPPSTLPSVPATHTTLTTHTTDTRTPSPDGIGRTIKIIAAVSVIFLIIVFIIVIIILVVRREKRARLPREKGRSDIVVSYGTNNPEYFTRNGTEQKFAAPIQDSEIRYAQNTDSNSNLHDVYGSQPTATSRTAAYVHYSPKHGRRQR